MGNEIDGQREATAPAAKWHKRYTFKKMIPLILFTIALVYGIVPLLVQTGFFTRAVLMPFKLDDNKIPTLSNGIEAEQIFFKNGAGDKLCAWYFKKPGATKIIVFNHGNAGNILHRLVYAEVFTRCNSSVFLFDYRGYGKSTGKPTIDGILEDGLAAYDYVHKDLGYAPQDIIVAGESIGTTVACNVASKHPCDRVLLQASLTSLASVAKSHFAFFRIYPDFVFPPLDNTKKIKNIQVPVLLIHGQKDTLVPFDNSEYLQSIAKEGTKLLALPHCGHNDIGINDADIYLPAVCKFINGNVLTKPADTEDTK